MAIKKSSFTASNGRRMMHSPYQANVPAVALISHTFTEAVAAADILELAILPPYCRILDLEIVSVGTGAVTADVGFMSGEPGSPDAARTVGAELFSAVTPTTAQRAALATLVGLASTETARGIGVKFSGAVAASASTKLHAKITYTTGS